MVDIITSAKNPIVKHARKLYTSAKYRREQGLAIAEGSHLAAAAIGASTEIDMVICAESALKDHEAAGLIEELSVVDAPIHVVKDGLFESMSSVHAAVGLLVIFRPKLLRELARLAEDSLLLEDIQDPGNLGTILRTAAATGVDRVYLSPGCASAWSPKAVRAGMGAQFELGIYENVDLISLASGSSVPVFATDLKAENSIYEVDLSGDCAWVFGSEGRGVSLELLEVCSDRIIIPQASTAVESLNVSAAVAVCLYEQHRQRLANKI